MTRRKVKLKNKCVIEVIENKEETIIIQKSLNKCKKPISAQDIVDSVKGDKIIIKR